MADCRHQYHSRRHALQPDVHPGRKQPGVADAYAELAWTEPLSPQPPSRSALYAGQGEAGQRIRSICQPQLVDVASYLLQLHQFHRLHSVKPVWHAAQELWTHHAL